VRLLRLVTSSIEAFDKFLVQFLFGLRELKMDTALALPTDPKKLG